ncbi:monooxygenase FAD-binding protein [Lophiostoma macrostomum CBS 122681]|uniref:Monooxygenase FAD-binding protein n=1 Tax=Lophiostoma macrostomum CBS 122681 TaxID=1314788 RepID=A0A6A6TLG0_9PLEO|nr:monooxygenase FAD-binding protein [Lophiostoma macrostomum CBS 122681]
MSTAPVVLIIGCGIAGPVVAILLKRKGYQPIVFEKVSKLADAGASLMLMSNGLKVLNLIGVADDFTTESTPITTLWDAKATGEILGQSNLPSTFTSKYGQPAAGIRRTSANLKLKQLLLDSDIEVREGWQLTDISESDSSVKASFKNGQSVTGSFLIGCDGIKATSRSILLKNQGQTESAADYTGLTQTAGISPTPASLLPVPAMRNWYSDSIHAISYPISPTHTSWAITQRESQEKEETWRPCHPDEMLEQRAYLSKLLAGWDDAVLELVNSSERIIKFGLFDRQELGPEQWYSRRCVLVGDAAHPTSPHLGQGANQALEDAYHLSQLLPAVSTDGAPNEDAISLLVKDLAEVVFKSFAEMRQPRTSALVRGARVQGESRVASGDEACQKRDAAIESSFRDDSIIAAKFDNFLSHPF